MTDYIKLNEKIKCSDYSMRVIARRMGISTQSLHNKRTGKRDFTIKEMLSLCKILSISKTERDEIFLLEDVSDSHDSEGQEVKTDSKLELARIIQRLQGK